MQITETVSTFDSPRSGGGKQEAHRINFDIVYAAIKRLQHQGSDSTVLPAS